ncbi:YhgE/Pip domain-containing protein [Solihabitans fulvus]|uniref:YhgE/Pip domain-containing protein n=1 Tax=Solihabitans fulvus TaxID=1892852 RepID=A0A5B2XFC9_9PSEU|nr:YhgE/Pip domain-containing protein [Solihabitans fulvus]KAA2261620.1 YhgE/Pip domain-containing protein [Solihabitans fulvus]
MTSVRMAVNELRRVSAGKLPKLAVFALILVPLLYGSLYLYANWDPYGNLKNVPAALVVQDTGATSSDGKHLEAGKEVATELLSGKKFDWRQVSASEAEAGVANDKYTFALTLPADFSQALLSPSEFKPRQGIITLTTNDANNYLGSTIANTVVSEVRRSVSAKIGTEAADKLLLGFSTIRGKTAEAADGATKLADGQAKLLDGSQKLVDGLNTAYDKTGTAVDGANRLRDGSAEVSSGLGTLRDQTKDLPSQSQQLNDGATKLANGSQQLADNLPKIADGNAQFAQKGNEIASIGQQFVGGLDQLNGTVAQDLKNAGFTDDQVKQVMDALGKARKPIDDVNGKIQTAAGQLNALADGSKQAAAGAKDLAAGAQQLSAGTSKLAAATPAMVSGINRLNDGAKQVADGNAQMADQLPQLRDGLGQLRDGATQLRDGEKTAVDGSAKLRDGLNDGVNQIPNPDDPTRQATAKTIGDPVAVKSAHQSEAGTYGAGLAPFFLGLATWIGGFVLFLLLRPLSRRALAAGQSSLRIAVGGWLPAAALGVAQVVVMYAMVTLAVGIHPARPFATFGFLLLTSMTFIAIIHALNALLGAVGKFLGLVLLILQLVSAGGTFPWQTIPGPLHPLHVGLPMGYVVDGLRHLIYGGDLSSIGKDVGVLVGYLVLGLALSTYAAYKQRVWTPSRLKPELVL